MDARNPRAPRRAVLNSLLTAALAILLLGCASSSAPVSVPSGATPAPTAGRIQFTPEQNAMLQHKASRLVPPQARAALAQLGAPSLLGSTVPSSRRASVALPYPFSAIQQYVNPGDAGYIGNSPDVVFGGFDVTMNPSGVDFPGNFSYILYRVDDIAPLPGVINVNFGGSGECGIAVYNWAYGSAGRWEPLFYGDVGGSFAGIPLDGVAGASWLNAGDDLAFVAFALAPSQVGLTAFELTETPANLPPIADMLATPRYGPTPLNTVLDAGASYDDDGTIALYEFDVLGDGNFVANGADATFDTQYALPGVFHPVVRVTDDGGLSTTWTIGVVANPGAYSETENNDNPGQANALPTIPFSGYFANVGPDGGNDGDVQDNFSFSANAGDTVSFLVDWAWSFDTELEVRIEDSFGQTWGTSSIGFPPQPVSHTFSGIEFAPFYLRIESSAGGTDYMIDASDTAYGETEDNDFPGNSNDLTQQLQFDHELVDFLCSLGSGPGYPGNDGDNDDWFTFSTDLDATLDLTTTYDTLNANIAVELLDGDLDVLASSATDSGTETFSHTFGVDDITPYFLHFVCTEDGADYTTNATITIANPGLDEQEDNDDASEANALPATFPFSGFSANIGFGGYDGDNDDYFSVDLSPGEICMLTVTPAEPFAYIAPTIEDSSGRTAGASEYDNVNNIQTVYVMARPGDTGPYILHLDGSTLTDYTIDGELMTTYSEVENNDDTVTATAMPDFFNWFSGSLGSGGSDYDGDSTDFFTFDANEGEQPTFTLFYDHTGGAAIPVNIRDSDNDVLSTTIDNGDGSLTITLDQPLDSGDVAPYFIECGILGGFSDYWISRAL